MSTFRTKVWTILGSVAGLSGCGGDTEKPDLREGLEGEGSELCRQSGSDPARFSHVAHLNPEGDYDYFEFRSGYYNATSAEDFTAQKMSIVDDPNLTPTEKKTALDDLLQSAGVYSSEVQGECDYAEGCDRFFVPNSGSGFPGIEGDRSYLFATGASGPAFVTNVEEARQFFGAIDTPQEAAWIAYAEGYRAVCSGAVFLETEDGYELYVEQGNLCGGDITGYRVSVSTSGAFEVMDSTVVKEGNDNCVIGRLPNGELSPACERDGEHPVGRYFAENARLEAASVVAFVELSQELAAYGAPLELVRWARRASDEEIRHAKMCARLAQRFGSAVGPVKVKRGERRTLLEMARNNAVEGLTREAFGALLAHHQMLTAADGEVRQLMRSIAHEEASHAEFSIALHQWLMTRLTAEQRQSVESARKEARQQFRMIALHTYDDEVTRLAGMPRAEVAAEMFDALFAPAAA